MILQEMQTVQIAEADWTDDGTVELLTFPTTGEHRTHMAPETARALARQLETAATEAEKAAGETGVQRAHRAVQHGFDVDAAPNPEEGFTRVFGNNEGEQWWGVLDLARFVIVPFAEPVDDETFSLIASSHDHGYVEMPADDFDWKVGQ